MWATTIITIFSFLLVVRCDTSNSDHHLLRKFLSSTAEEIFSTKQDFSCYDYNNIKSKKEDDWYFTTRQNAERTNVTFIYYVFCPEVREMGNQVGAYFNEVACALESGAHFSIYKNYPDSMSPALRAFFSAFSTVIINNDYITNNTREEVKSRSRTACPCDKYCWSELNAPWLHHIKWIVEVLRTATSHFSTAYGIQNMIPQFENATLSFPAIPDVAIQ